ncbi:MAG: hypothetical protein KF895_07625 [Parvibaculum sp.]|nr:hypothetical protein [Parvibaculum sp.]
MSEGKHITTLVLALALTLPLSGEVRAQDVQAEETGEVPSSGDIQYETSDPVGTPPVNYRSGYDDEYSSPETRDAEMYAEEYERRKQQELIKEREQLDRINNFSSGAVTTEGVMGGRR